jgi:hypothetical protein
VVLPAALVYHEHASAKELILASIIEARYLGYWPSLVSIQKATVGSIHALDVSMSRHTDVPN